MAVRKLTKAEIEEEIRHTNENQTSLCIVGWTYTFLGVPPAWVRGKVIAENLVCILLEPGSVRLGHNNGSESEYEDMAAHNTPTFQLPVKITKSPQIQILCHGKAD